MFALAKKLFNSHKNIFPIIYLRTKSYTDNLRNTKYKMYKDKYKMEPITITGNLHYIDAYKRLFVINLDAKSTAVVNSLKIDGNSPILINDELNLTVRINLDKYTKPYIKKYEKLVHKRLQIRLEPRTYDSISYGKGLSLTLLSFKIVDDEYARPIEDKME